MYDTWRTHRLFFPGFAETLGGIEIANVSIPVAVVLLFMMYPVMLKIEFSKIAALRRNSKPLLLTLVVNWAIKPFTMAAISYIFMRYIYLPLIPPSLAEEYIAGMILLGLAPCTAMVLVWTYLADGNLNYALLQVAVNDLIILFIFAPLGKLLIGVSTNFPVPFATIFWSVVFYVAIPLGGAYITRRYVLKKRGQAALNKLIRTLDPVTKIGLLLTLVLIFSFQGKIMIENPLHIALIAIPLFLQTYLIFGISYFGARMLKIDYPEAAPSCFIGPSNFFELAVAVALILFGMESGAVLATVVGVLTEVPIMLLLVAIMKRNRKKFHFTRELIQQEQVQEEV